MVPYLELLIRNELAERIDAEVVRYKTTAKGLQVLRCFQQIEEMMGIQVDTLGRGSRRDSRRIRRVLE